MLYPNPARDRVFINVDQPTEVGVFSITGSLMLTKRVESPNDPIDVTGLTRGMYLVRPLKTTSFALKLSAQGRAVEAAGLELSDLQADAEGLGLFTGQIVFGLSIAFAASSFFLSFFSFSGGAVV